MIVLEVPFYQVLLFEDLNNFFLIRDDREVKYGKENRYVNQTNLNKSKAKFNRII